MSDESGLIDLGSSLSQLEGLFHKEDQFKLEFALLLSKLLEKQGTTGSIRVEWHTEQANNVDLAIRTQNCVVPIELKYKTREANVYDKRWDERFRIARQGDYNHGMYSFVKDI